jgi:hypothetical protein
VSAYKLSSTTFLIEYNTVGTAGNAIAFSTTAGNISLNGTGYLGGTVAGRANGVTVGTPTYYTSLITNPHPDLSVANLPSLGSTDLIFGVDRFKYDGILIMPPADGTYTISVYGAFYSVLENNIDVSYYSEVYPELLIMASNLCLEAFYRNTQGVMDWYNSMKIWLDGIDKDIVNEEMVLAGNQMKG